MRELFIYYRIDARRAPCALEAAQAMQQGLRDKHPQLAARLWRRPDEPGSSPTDETPTQQTWMETYSFADTGVTPELQAEIEEAAAGLLPFIVGSRHTEVFVPCAS
jgi:hypothetical protein